MKITVLNEAGYNESILGLSLSYNTDIGRAEEVAKKLWDKDGGHNKFLESISVWIDIDAPRYWWSQFDTYRIGITKQSESTMHTLTKRELELSDFEDWIPYTILKEVNWFICKPDLTAAKAVLPESFLQRRVVATNYKTLRHIIAQRESHKLKQWQFFCSEIRRQVQHPEYFGEIGA